MKEPLINTGVPRVTFAQMRKFVEDNTIGPLDNAASATKLQTARNINGVAFDGTADITVAAAAGTLTGATLASNVLASSLTSVGTLSALTVSSSVVAPGITRAGTVTVAATGVNQILLQTNGTTRVTVASNGVVTIPTLSTASISTGSIEMQASGFGLISSLVAGNIGFSLSAQFLASTSGRTTLLVAQNIGTSDAVSTGNYSQIRVLARAAAGWSVTGAAVVAGLEVSALSLGSGASVATYAGIYIANSSAATDNYAIWSRGGRMRFENLPTSATGLNAGELWNNGGVINIV